MGFRYHLRLYVASTASNVRTHVRGKLVANKPLLELLEREAPTLLKLFEEEKLQMYVGKHPTQMSLEEATSRLAYDVSPIVSVVKRSANPFVKCDLYFSDTTITNAFKSGAFEKWKKSGFNKRSGGQPLEHGWMWGLLYKLVNDLKVTVCYTPFDDPVMRKYHDELKAEYRRIVKQLKKKWNSV